MHLSVVGGVLLYEMILLFRETLQMIKRHGIFETRRLLHNVFRLRLMTNINNVVNNLLVFA